MFLFSVLGISVQPNLQDDTVFSKIDTYGALSRGNPSVPWIIAVSTVTVILLMMGVGNQYLLHFLTKCVIFLAKCFPIWLLSNYHIGYNRKA